jgi:hypothetical protein
MSFRGRAARISMIATLSLTGLLAGVEAALSQQKQPPRLTKGKLAPGVGAPQLSCTVTCGSGADPQPVAKLSWFQAGMPLGPKSMRPAGAAAQTSITLEATIFDGGFENEQFATFDTKAAKPGIRPSRTIASDDATPIPGLDLKVKTFALAKPVAGGGPPSAQTTSIDVEGLSAGLIYQWRMRFSGPAGTEYSLVARCRAPICVRDEVREKKE